MHGRRFGGDASVAMLPMPLASVVAVTFLTERPGIFLRMPLADPLAETLMVVVLTTGPLLAFGVVDDGWSWYTGMTPYEQCQAYLRGDPDIERVLAEDLSECAELWGPRQD